MMEYSDMPVEQTLIPGNIGGLTRADVDRFARSKDAELWPTGEVPVDNSRTIQWQQQGKVFELMRRRNGEEGSNQRETYCYFAGKEGDQSIAVILTTIDDVPGVSSAPFRFYMPGDELFKRVDQMTNQATKRREFLSFAKHELNLGVMGTPGFGAMGGVLEPAARLLLRDYQDANWRIGMGVLSPMGSEGSTVIGKHSDAFTAEMALVQIYLGLKRQAELMGNDTRTDGWLEDPWVLIGHSMGATYAFRFLREYADKFPNISGVIVGPVILGPGYIKRRGEMIPNWVDSIIRAGYDKDLRLHVTLLTNLVSNLVKVGVAANNIDALKFIANKGLEFAEEKFKFISLIINSYTGRSSYGGKSITEMHVDRFLKDPQALARQIRLLAEMAIIAGDKTMSLASQGSLPPFLVAVPGNDGTLTPELMQTWAGNMSLSDFNERPNGKHVFAYNENSGHYPTREFWEEIFAWLVPTMKNQWKHSK